MQKVESICAFLEAFAPVALAEDWDNVGLLVGDRERTVERVMTCLTVTPESAAEAVDERVDLVVAHHPMPFRPIKRLTTDSHEGRLLWDLTRAGVSVYSPHTAFDSCAQGINRQLADGLQLADVAPLVPASGPEGAAMAVDIDTGGGRHGMLDSPTDVDALVARVKSFLAIERVQVVGERSQTVRRVAVACGSAGEFLGPAIAAGCDVLVTGEVSFHTCLEAKAAGVALILSGHYASERFAVETLAQRIAEAFGELSVWASRREHSPLEWC